MAHCFCRCAISSVYISCFIYLFLFIARSRALLYDKDQLDDILTPYKSYLEHLDVGRTHRHVRECQPVLYGNTTHEKYAKKGEDNAKGVEYRTFRHKIKEGRIVYGHLVTVKDPYRRLSVLQPSHNHGCEEHKRSTVAMSSKQMKCRVAMNAGYFNTHTGSCLGNIVSNGKLVRDARGIQNANFGILKNGSLITGYLNEHEVTPGEDNTDFYQLVTGVVWLLRNGTIYVNESLKAECRDTEETGSLWKFANVISARTSIGHDEDGNVIIVQIDGKTNHKGVDLFDFAHLLKSFGLVNAINLDGGGSATFVVNHTVVNYPSDECENYLCARKVSTILCVHDETCLTTGCNKRGKCQDDGQCLCEKPWTGLTCSEQEKQVHNHSCPTAEPDKLTNSSQMLTLDEENCHNSNCSKHNTTTKALIKRFLQNNYAWLDALLGVSLIVNLILLAIIFCCGTDKIQLRRGSVLELKEDRQKLLNPHNYDDDEI